MTPLEIVKFIQGYRFPLSSEMKAQDSFFHEMALAGVHLEREVELGPEDRIDFMHGTIGIEFKVKGRRREIYWQCERYCQHERVEHLVLASPVTMGSLDSINGKPFYFCRLGGWM